MADIVALGQHVVLKAIAKSARKEQKSAGGLLLPPKNEGEIPTHCEVYSIGPDVPKDLFEVGDKTPFPLGDKLNCPHPDVIAGLCKAEDRDDKYMSTHWSNISCIYE